LIRFVLLTLVLAAQACSAPSAPEIALDGHPTRIVSMNPCIDSILMEIAQPQHIAAVSHYSHDSRSTSVPLEWALRFPAVSNAAEDIIAAQPDLVIAGPHVALQTIAALQRLHIPLMQVATPETVDQSKKQIEDISVRIGEQKAGAALVARIDSAVTAARSTDDRIGDRPVDALIWQGSGLVPGSGTLADELLTRTGFRNVSAALGLQRWDLLPLEKLLFSPPAVLLVGVANMGESESEANRMLSHPAWRKAREHMRVADFPSSLLNCGGPTIIRTVERLADVRRSFGTQP
jgi:iron complex transport system substrate-binding protein